MSETTFAAPTWRHDISIEEDLVEEIARHAGFESIADELPPAYHAGEYQPNEHRLRRLRSALVDLGFDEAISYSFIPISHDEIFETLPNLVDNDAAEKLVTLKDSVIEGSLRMRPTILPGLLAAVRHNFNHQQRDLKLFEIGRVFAAGDLEHGLPKEVVSLALVLTGGLIGEDRSMPERPLDFYDAKGAVETAVSTLGLNNIEFRPLQSRHLATGQAASLTVDGTNIGSLGRLSDDIAASYKFRQDVFVCEFDLSAALAINVSGGAYKPLSIFPGIRRDVSLIAKRDVNYADIRTAIRSLGFELCREVSFVDLYEGKGLDPNERSITIRLEYRSDERTLVEREVDEVHSRILEELQEKLSITPRA